MKFPKLRKKPARDTCGVSTDSSEVREPSQPRETTYIKDLEDLYSKTKKHIQPFGRCLSLDSGTGVVRFLLYEVRAFKVSMPQEPNDTFSFQYFVTEETTIQRLLGKNLAFVENTEADFAAAIETVHNYARLLTPDKFLAAYEAARTR